MPTQHPMTSSTGAVSASSGGALAATSEHGSGVGAAPQWPLASSLELGALPTAAGCARDHTRLVLAEWGLTHLITDATTLTSELITNALRASWTLPDSPPIVLRLLANERQLLIEAWDQCVEHFDLTPRATNDIEHGRGLLVVEALASRWGVGRMGSRFKVVWCELLIGSV
jgi:anti-sigma regulatory factor (Ser/Thr protein kinase)